MLPFPCLALVLAFALTWLGLSVGWNNEIRSMTTDYCFEDSKGLWHVGVSVIMRVTLADGCYHEDMGCV